MTLEVWAAAIDSGMKTVLRPDDFDITFEDDIALELSTDSWTLHIEPGPSPVAWIALDDDPDEPGLMSPVLQTELEAMVISAFKDIDSTMKGQLVAGLRFSNDSLSETLAMLITDESPKSN